jgi:hypothetical protein
VPALSHQDRAAVHVENFPGDKSGEGRTEKNDWRGDFFWLAHATERDGRKNFGSGGRVIQCGRGHIGGDPAGRDTVDVNAIPGEFRGQPFNHADDRTFAGGVVAVERFAPLAGSRTDQHDVAGAVLFHLDDRRFHQGKDAIEVDSGGLFPLVIGHMVDGRVMRFPDTVVSNQNVESPEALDCFHNQRPRGFGAMKIASHGSASFGADFADEGFGLVSSFLVIKHDVGAGFNHHPDSGSADAARATGDESHLIFQGESDGHKDSFEVLEQSFK